MDPSEGETVIGATVHSLPQSNTNITARCSMVVYLLCVLSHNTGEDAIDGLNDDVKVVEGELPLVGTNCVDHSLTNQQMCHSLCQ